MAKAKISGTDLALVPSIADEDCGQALRLCTPMQRKFVAALLVIPDPLKESEAARIAGYSQPANDASQMMKNPKILAAIREEADKRLRGCALIASRALMQIAANPMHKDQLKAADILLNRAGLQVVTEHHVVVEDSRTNAELIESIKTIAKAQGLDPKTLLGNNAVEGEFTEVDTLAQTVNSGLDDHTFTIFPNEFPPDADADDLTGDD